MDEERAKQDAPPRFRILECVKSEQNRVRLWQVCGPEFEHMSDAQNWITENGLKGVEYHLILSYGSFNLITRGFRINTLTTEL